MYIFLIILLAFLWIKRATLLCMYAKIKYYRGDTQKAEKIFSKAFKIGTPAVEYQFIYGYILLTLGKLEKANKVLSLASMSKAKPQVMVKIRTMRALVHWKQGDIDTAIEILEEIYAEFKTTAIYQDLGLMYIIKGDKEKALKFNLEAYEYNDDDNMIMDNLAEAYALSGEVEKAEEIYKKLLEREPRFAEAYWGYGLLLCEKGEVKEGVELMKKSLEKRITFLSMMQKEEIEALISKWEN